MLFISFVANIYGQEKVPYGNFIYTYSQGLKKVDHVRFERPMFSSPYFIVDSVKYDNEDLKFYKNEAGFYANIKDQSFWGFAGFAECVSQGEINLFKYETTGQSVGTYNASTGTFTGGGSMNRISNYYNRGFGELKDATYKNLLVELADNPVSQIHLEEYRKAGKRQNWLIVAGSVAVGAGLATLISKTSKDYGDNPEPSVAPNVALIIGGMASFGVSYHIYLSKPKHLQKAVDTYNM